MILRNKLKEKHGTGNIKLCIYSQKKATVPYIYFPPPVPEADFYQVDFLPILLKPEKSLSAFGKLQDNTEL